ncbi:cupin domain-containing protein [Saccharopolyspora sp. NPDC000995]
MTARAHLVHQGGLFTSDVEATTAGQKPQSNAWQSAITVLQEAEPHFIPSGAHAMTVVVEFPPGGRGTPPHRHSGPAFGYALDGEMVFELEGEPARVVRAGETFWEPGGDVIHYQDGNNRDDIPVRYTVTIVPAARAAAALAQRAHQPAVRHGVVEGVDRVHDQRFARGHRAHLG